MAAAFTYYETIQDSKHENIIHLHLHEQSDYPTHFHRKLEITYVVEDIVLSTINNVEYVAHENDILFVPTYYSHSYKTSEASTRIIIMPNQEFTGDLRNTLGDKALPCLLSDKEFNKAEIYPLLQKLFHAKKDGSILTKKGYLNVVFGKMLEHYPLVNKTTNKQIDILVKILSYVDEHFFEEITLETLSAEFGYNKYHFSKLFNKFVGDSLTNYVNNVRLKNFVELYSNSHETNITKLAYSVGFNSMPSFYRVFSKAYNGNPKDVLTKIK